MASLGGSQEDADRSTYSTVLVTNISESIWKAPNNCTQIFLTESVNKYLGDQAKLLNVDLNPSKHCAVLKVQGEIRNLKKILGPTDSNVFVPMYAMETSVTFSFLHANFTKQVLELASKYLLCCSCHNGKVTVAGGIHNINCFLAHFDSILTDLPIDPVHGTSLESAVPSSVSEVVSNGDLQVSSSAADTQLSDLSPDVLALLEKIPEGNFPSVVYDSKTGSVRIFSHKDVVDFNSAYQGILCSDRLKTSCITIPKNLDCKDVAARLVECNKQYNLCNFTMYEGAGAVKVVSLSARQLDQAVKLLKDELNRLASSSLSSFDTIVISSGRMLTLKKADIVHEQVDILVNAANERLVHGGGVAAAIDKASHGAVQKYSRLYVQQHGCVSVGNLAVTNAGGALKCDYIFHVVGPNSSYSPKQCKWLLQQVIQRALAIAEQNNFSSIAFPAVSAGIFGVDKLIVTQSIVDAILDFPYSKASPVLHDIRIVIIDKLTHQRFAHYFSKKKKECLGVDVKLSVASESSHVTRQPLEQNTTPAPTVLPHILTSSPTSLSTFDAVHQTSDYASQDSTALLPIATSDAEVKSKILTDDDKSVHSTQYQATLQASVDHQESEKALLSNNGISQQPVPIQPVLSMQVLHDPGEKVKEIDSPSGDHDLIADNKLQGGSSIAESSIKAAGIGTMSSSASETCPTMKQSGGGDGKTQKHCKRKKKEHVLSQSKRNEKVEDCPICLEIFNSPVRTKCGHQFCNHCLDECLRYSPYCPACKVPLRALYGNQPKDGRMAWKVNSFSLPGYEKWKTIEINYYIPDGVQVKQHPNPGHHYHGVSRNAYLPDSPEGNEVLWLLKKAFDCGLIFTVGTSVTTGISNVVVWNDIHHKTNTHGGPASYGYPDETYLQRVKADLAAKGIVPDKVH